MNKKIYVVHEDFHFGKYTVKEAILLKENSKQRKDYGLTTNYEIRYKEDKEGSRRGYNIIFTTKSEAEHYCDLLYTADIKKTASRLIRLIERT